MNRKKITKIPKCKRTVTGYHIWELYDVLVLDASDPKHYLICKVCELVDDRVNL